MTRYIVILTLALTAGLSSGNASAQEGVSIRNPSQRNTHDGFLDSCMKQCFALVDSGYTEAEAFEMMTLENGGSSFRAEYDNYDNQHLYLDSGYTEAEAFEMMMLENGVMGDADDVPGPPIAGAPRPPKGGYDGPPIHTVRQATRASWFTR